MTLEYSANKFISALVKNLQAVCHGNFDFDDNVKVVGHLYLTVDSCSEFNYILNEKVTKCDRSSTTFVSKSFHAIDQQQIATTPKKLKNESLPSSDSRKEVRKSLCVDLTEADCAQTNIPQNKIRESLCVDLTEADCNEATIPQNKIVLRKRTNYTQNQSPVVKQRKISQSPLDMPRTCFNVDSEHPVKYVTTSPEGKNIEPRNPRLDSQDNKNGVQANSSFNKVHCKKEIDSSAEVKVTPTEKAEHDLRVPSVYNSDIDLSQLKCEVDVEFGDNSYTANVSEEANEVGDESFFSRLREQPEGLYHQSELEEIGEKNSNNTNPSSTLNYQAASKPVTSGIEDQANNTQTEKSNVCTECGSAFARKWDLRRHREVVHLKIKFRCSYCDLTYCRKDHLVRHKKKIHPDCPR